MGVPAALIAFGCGLLAGTGALSAQDGWGPVLPGLDPHRELNQFHLEQWTERDGLPQNFVNALAQTPDGYLWLGSERGLIRFDGTRFSILTPENTAGLTTAWVTALAAGADGTLWVGTGGGGLVRYRDGVLTPMDLGDAAEGGLAPNINRLLLDSRGRLWIGTDGDGLHMRDGDGVRRVGKDQGLLGERVLALAEAPGGDVWVGSSGGIQRLTERNERAGLNDPTGMEVLDRMTLEFAPRPEALEGIRATALASDPDGTLWIGTPGNGLLRFRHGELSRPDDEGELAGAVVSSLLRDRQGSLWVGANGGGLFRLRDALDPGESGGVRISRMTAGEGLPSNLVWDLLEDREGNLWLGMNAAGLVRLQDGLFETVGRPEGLSMDVALALRETRDGALWVGTPGGGVNRIRGAEITIFTTEQGLGGDLVLSVAEGPEGEVWVGTPGGGVSRIRGDEVRAFGLEDGLTSLQVSAVHADATGAIWLGFQGAGVQRWRPEPSLRYTTADGLPGGSVTTLVEDRAGRLWVGTQQGLARLGEEGVTSFTTGDGLPHGHVLGLHADEDGGIWVATMGGLAWVREDRVRALGATEGLTGPEPMAVTEDGDGYLWISSSQGFTRVARADLESVARGQRERVVTERFGRAHGLRSLEANGGIHPAAWRAGDGAIWFPTMAGAVRVDPRRTHRPTLPPTPVLEMLVAGERSLPLNAEPPLELGERTLEFHFSAPTFIAPREVRFRYRLEGFDPDWIEPRERRSAFYTNLPPGRYHFRVAAAGADGIWTATEVMVPVRIPPYLRERRSAQAAGLLLLLLLGVVGYRARIRNLERRENELVALVAERERSESALRRSEERLHLAMEAGRMGTWEWGLETGAVAWSSGMEEILGPSPGSLEGFRQRLRSSVRPEDIEAVEAVLDRVLRREVREFNLDFPIQRPGEAVRHVELRGRWIPEAEDGRAGAGRRVVGVVADVSLFIETQRALRAREEELRQAQKMEAVGRLAGGVAHDFNNLLSVIGMNARLALGSIPEESPAREELEETVRAGDRAAELTRQLLAFSRKQILQPRLLDLNETVLGVERMLRRLIRSNVALETELDPSIGTVRADAGGVEQILVNLLVNAQDAMPEGGTVVIRTQNASGRPRHRDPIVANPHVVLSVTDTGHGMDEETLHRIFEPFFTTKGIGEGTGLGLASVYGVVQQSGARIEVSSEVGVGTMFQIRFPRVDGGGSGEEVEVGVEAGAANPQRSGAGELLSPGAPAAAAGGVDPTPGFSGRPVRSPERIPPPS